MRVRKPKELAQDLQQGKIEPIYFLFGPETYLRDAAAREIADEALRDTLLREFNDISISLGNRDARTAVGAAEQLPMMSSRRVVRVTDFTKLDEENEEILLRYIGRPVETSVVIFVADEIDKRKKLAKTLMQGAAFEFAALSDGELAAWARALLKELKSEIETSVLCRIIVLVGPVLHTLYTVMYKIYEEARPDVKLSIRLLFVWLTSNSIL